MKRSIFKPILAGILIGAALFFIPFFLLRVLIVFLIIGGLFRLFGGRGFRGRYNRGFHPAFADKIRNMSDEEYNQYKQNMGSCGSNNNSKQTTNENK
ncbi:MAG: hypothetical protein H0U39_11190 [Segetibacter sp.]|nr:hypothetical protein [Segetibacter sp.]